MVLIWSVLCSVVIHLLALILPHPSLWGAVPENRSSGPTAKSVSVDFRRLGPFEDVVPATTVYVVKASEPELAKIGLKKFPEKSGRRSEANFPSPETITKPAQLIGVAPGRLEHYQETTLRGNLLMRLVVDEGGIVRHIETIRSSIPSEVEVDLVLTFYRGVYLPGERDGKPVTSEIRLLIEFGNSGLIGLPMPE